MVSTARLWGQDEPPPIVRVEYFAYSRWSISKAWTGGFLGRLGGEEPKLGRANCRLGAVGDPEFTNYALHMSLHGQSTLEESLRDLPIGLPLGKQAQHFNLPLRQRVQERVRAFMGL